MSATAKRKPSKRAPAKRGRARRSSSAPFEVRHFERWAKALRLEDGQPWIVEDYFLRYLEDVFAAYGARELVRLWLIVGEGNGKTTNLAGLALYHAEFFPARAFAPWAASARDQAEIGYSQAKVLALSMPPARRPRCYDGYRRIEFPDGSRIQVFAAGAEHADGVIPTLPILDELHRHKGLGLYRTWAGKLKKRHAQMPVISTAGEPGSDFEETRERIRAEATEITLDGAFGRFVAGRVVMHEYAVRDVALIDDMDAVKAANPASWIDREYLLEKRADPDMSPAHWRRFTCNIATMDAEKELLLQPDEWLELADGTGVPAGATGAIGADGSRVWDSTVVAYAAKHEDGRIDISARVFSAVPDRPHHVLHSGGKIDFDDVEGYILDLFVQYDPIETAYDPRYLERSMELVDARLPSAAIHPIEPQSKQMRDALQAFYTAAVDGVLRHDGDKVVAAHLANCKVERDPTTRAIRRIGKVDQRKSIDAVPALALAVWRALEATDSVYKSRGVVTV